MGLTTLIPCYLTESKCKKICLGRSVFCFHALPYESKLSTVLHENKKGLSKTQTFLHLSAERTLQSSNLKPLNELENSRLKMVVSRYKIEAQNHESVLDVLLQDISAINDFLFCIESEPFITPEKAKNIRRVPFNKVMAAYTYNGKAGL